MRAKRILAMIMACLTVPAVFSGGVFALEAEFAGGNGTKDNPYNPLTGTGLLAADANKDKSVSFADIQRIYPHLSTANKLF